MPIGESGFAAAQVIVPEGMPEPSRYVVYRASW
jgi:hypothetical protein